MTAAAQNTSGSSGAPPPTRRSWIGKLLTAAAILAVAGSVYVAFGERLSLSALAHSESQLRAAIEQSPMIAIGAAFVVYVLWVGLSLPGASVLTPAAGWLFGFWVGVVFASFAATTGATIAFLISRYLLRDSVARRWGERLQTVQAAIDRDGAFYLLTLRLVPAFPFFLVNLLMGLTSMRTWTYWWVSQLGMLPATCVFVYAGTTVPTLQELSTSTRALWNWQFLAALTALGLLPLGLRYLLKLRRAEPPYGTN